MAHQNLFTCNSEKDVLEAIRSKKNFILSPTLTNFKLILNKIDAEEGKLLSEALSGNYTLTKLSLGFNEMGETEGKALSSLLMGNNSLKELVLTRNHITDIGARVLSSALKGNAALTTLNLDDNDISDKGAESLSELLKSNTTISTLLLHDNKVGSSGAKALLDALNVNTTLTELNLQNNNISESEVTTLSDALKRNCTLKSFKLPFYNPQSIFQPQILPHPNPVTNLHPNQSPTTSQHPLSYSAFSQHPYPSPGNNTQYNNNQYNNNQYNNNQYNNNQYNNNPQPPHPNPGNPQYNNNPGTYNQHYNNPQPPYPNPVTYNQHNNNPQLPHPNPATYNPQLPHPNPATYNPQLPYSNPATYNQHNNNPQPHPNLVTYNQYNNNLQPHLNPTTNNQHNNNLQPHLNPTTYNQHNNNPQPHLNPTTYTYNQYNNNPQPHPNPTIYNQHNNNPQPSHPNPGNNTQYNINHTPTTNPGNYPQYNNNPGTYNQHNNNPHPQLETNSTQLGPNLQQDQSTKLARAESIKVAPVNRYALIITMSKYEGTKYMPLTAPRNDGKAIHDFLCNYCSFRQEDVVWIQDKCQATEIEAEFAKLTKHAMEARTKGNLLIFIYYSGHGSFNINTGKTGGHLINGDPFELEERLELLHKNLNTSVIALFDCCREERKGQPKLPLKIPGQLTLIHAVPIGAARTATSGQEIYSNATKTFLSMVHASNYTFPKCIDTHNFTQESESLIVTHQLKYQVILKQGAVYTLIEREFSEWSTEELIQWLSTLRIQTPDYEKTIRDGGYNGNYFVRLFDDKREDLFALVFKFAADIHLVLLEMGRVLQRRYFN